MSRLQIAGVRASCPRVQRFGFSVLTLLAAVGCSDPEPDPRPNVILVVVDTLRSDRLSTYGYSRPNSPWLDARASEGVLFEDVTSQSGWTLPSMTSMFTSRYLTAYRESIPEEDISLPEAFQRAGYTTVGVVANMSLTDKSGIPRGFDHYDLRWGANPFDDGELYPRTLEEIRRDLGEALDEVESDRQGKPLFLHIHPFDPHDPYFQHEELDAEFPIDEAEPVSPPSWHRDFLGRFRPRPPEGDPNWNLNLQVIARNRGKYDQEVRYTDRVLEQTFADLEARGLLDNAVVLFVSDHGEGLWDHVALNPREKFKELNPPQLFYQKHGQHLYQEAIATPMVLWGTGIPAGLRISDAVENVDIYPTLLELADVAPRGTLHGRSLVPYLDERPIEPKATVHAFLHHAVSVRDTKTGFKLIVPSAIEGRQWMPPIELYHLPSDPHERANVAKQNPDVVAHLRNLIGEWNARYPSESTIETERDPEQAERLRALGYTEEDIGR